MKHVATLLLETDTIDWLDRVAQTLSKQRNSEVTRSGALEYIVAKHWKKVKTRSLEKQAEKGRIRREIAG